MAINTGVQPVTTPGQAPNIGALIKGNLPTIGGIVGGIAGSPLDAVSGVGGTVLGAGGGAALGTILQNLLGGKGALNNPGNIAKNTISNGLLGLIPGAGELGASIGDSTIQRLLGAALPSGALAGASQGVQDIGSGKSSGQVASDVGIAALTGGTINGVATPILDQARKFVNTDLPDQLVQDIQKNPEQLASDINEEAKTKVGSLLSASQRFPQEQKQILQYAVDNDIYDPEAPVTQDSMMQTAVNADKHAQVDLSKKFDTLYGGKTYNMAPEQNRNVPDFQGLVDQLPTKTQRLVEPNLPTTDDYKAYYSAGRDKSSTALANWPVEKLQQIQKDLRSDFTKGATQQLKQQIDNVLSSKQVLTDPEMDQFNAIRKEYAYTKSISSNAKALFASKDFDHYTPEGIKADVDKAVSDSLTGKINNLKGTIRNWSIPAMAGGYAVAGWPGGLIARLGESALVHDLDAPAYMKLGNQALNILQNPKAQAVGTAVGGVNGLIQQLLARAGQQPNQNTNGQ